VGLPQIHNFPVYGAFPSVLHPTFGVNCFTLA
jgi:hypothetical protein